MTNRAVKKVQLTRLDAHKVVDYIKNNFDTYNNPEMSWQKVADELQTLLGIQMSHTAAKTCTVSAGKLLGKQVSKRAYRKKQRELVKQSRILSDQQLLDDLSNINTLISSFLTRIHNRQKALEKDKGNG